MRDFTNTDTIYEKTLHTINIKIREEHRTKRVLRRYTIIKTPDDIHKILRFIFKKLDDSQAHAVLLILNSDGLVTGYKVLSSGTQRTYTLDPALVFRNAILLGATHIVIAHNDPNDVPTFFQQDLDISEKLMRLGALHGIPVLDHIVMVHNNFRSLREYSRNFYRFVQDDIAAEQAENRREQKQRRAKYDA